MKQIPLTQGKTAIVDDEDYEYLSQFKWCVYKSGTYFRVAHRNHRKTEYMHRLIMKAKPKQIIDHIDRNSLNNQKSNLRFCTPQQNILNRSKRGNAITSRYKGVYRSYRDKRWIVDIKQKGKRIYSGYFTSEEEAARAYDSKILELFGDFACTNQDLQNYSEEKEA